MTEHDNLNARLTAIGILLERGFGKPPQDLNIGGQNDEPLIIQWKNA